mmetsp:Transcript_44500/g.71519  ORF Transcript_44500/g.71519 Transcript_44500/m.71519 type:complete len:552 (+) Transcript_44500:27-1682(+)
MAKGLYRRALLLILGGALLPSGWLRVVAGGGGHASSVLARAGAPAAAILSCVGNQHARSEGHSEHELRPSHVEGGMLRLRGGAGELRKSGEGLQTRTRRKTEVMELDREQEVEATVKRRAQERRSDVGSALVFPSQQEVHKKESVEIDLFGKTFRYHCHSDKVVKELSASEKADRQKEKDLRTLRAPYKSGANDGGLRLEGVHKKKQAVQKRSSINCSLATEHGLFNATELADYLRQRIKFNNKLHNLDNAIDVVVEGDDVVISAYRATQMKRKRKWERKMVLADAFSTRYLRYLMKKFIIHKELKDYIRPVSVDFSLACQEKGGDGVRFEMRYTSIHKNKHLRVKLSRKYGTRLEIARKEMFNQVWADQDANKIQVTRTEMLMDRKIKATQERVGGMDWLNKTRLTVKEAKAESINLLQHWVELQHKTYRAPFGGAMRGWLDRSICRHDPDRIGKKSHGTAGYTASNAVRSRTGTRLGIESLLYTGTAPDGMKGVRNRVKSQRLGDRAQKTLYRVSKSYSRQGDADRTIYNWKPKWLFSGKMDLHKRDWR